MTATLPPPAHDWRIHLATMGPLGRMRKAPGTWGSIPGIFLGVMLRQMALALWPDNHMVGFGLAYLVILALCFLAVYAIRFTEAAWDLHDPKSIVVDETLGQAIVSIMLPPTWLWMAIGFGLFRLFDIAKPWPVSYFDQKVPGPWGTLGDDLVAGVMALAVGLVMHFFIGL